jgi:hypothetical protein
MRLIIALLLVLVAAPCLADSVLLSDESSLSFVSVKNVDGAEAHRIANLTGSLSDAGDFTVDIHLDSVDTQVPIRDERMRGVLFDTGTYPLARVTGSVEASLLDGLTDGGSTLVAVPFGLDLHGQKTELTAQVRITRAGNAIEVTTVSPVMLQAASVGLDQGIEQLREIAGLQSIGKAVPVYFVLRFTAP